MIYARPGATFYAELVNAPTGLAGTLGVRILHRSDGATAAERTAAGIAEQPAGSGRYVATLTAPEVVGSYTVFWDDGTVGPTTTAAEDLTVNGSGADTASAGYPSTAEIVADSTTAALTDLEPTAQEALREEAITAIEGYCGQSFTAEGTEDEPAERILDGQGGDVLYLPQRLASLSSLLVPGGALSAADVVLSDDHDRLSIAPEAEGGSTWVTRAYADARGTRALCFPVGNAGVKVDGVWGWADDEVPGAVATALRFDMEDRALANAHALAETARSARALGLTGVDQGGLSIGIGAREPEVSTRVARLLSDLVWVSAAGATA